MIQISKEFPSVLFILSGLGEENDDIWKAFFRNKNCKEQKAIITFPPIDLKEV